jgi:hypothetical protein
MLEFIASSVISSSVFASNSLQAKKPGDNYCGICYNSGQKGRWAYGPRGELFYMTCVLKTQNQNISIFPVFSSQKAPSCQSYFQFAGGEGIGVRSGSRCGQCTTRDGKKGWFTTSGRCEYCPGWPKPND